MFKQGYLTEKEKAKHDHLRGKWKGAKQRLKEYLIKRTKEAPHELIVIFRLFGERHGISEQEMLKLMKEITTIKSRKIAQNVFANAAGLWEAFLEGK